MTNPAGCEVISFQEINFSDPIFDSIKIDYPDHEEWRTRNSASGSERCALIVKSLSGAYAGIAILKYGEDPFGPSRYGLKISTFKVAPEAEYRGTADLLLSQVFSKAIDHEVDVVFIAVLPGHEDVVRYLELRGFRRSAKGTGHHELLYTAELCHPERIYAELNRLAYDLLADEYQERSTSPGPTQESPDFLAHLLTSRLAEPVRRVLELGPGSGEILSALGKVAQDSVGVEISPRMAEVACRRAPNALMIVADIQRLDFPANSFDGIYAGAFLHLFPRIDAGNLVHRIARWTRPGGVVFANTSVSSEPGESLEVKMDYLHRVARYRSRWTEQQFRELLEENGLVITDRVTTDERERAKFWVAFLCTPARGGVSRNE